jgi:hypothetical protein
MVLLRLPNSVSSICLKNRWDTVGEPISPLTKPRFPQGVLHASVPSEGSCVRRHVGASEFANSIRWFSEISYKRCTKNRPIDVHHAATLALLGFSRSSIAKRLKVPLARIDEVSHTADYEQMEARVEQELSSQLLGRHWKLCFLTITAIEKLLKSRDKAYICAGITHATALLQHFNPAEYRHRFADPEQALQSTKSLMDSLRRTGDDTSPRGLAGPGRRRESGRYTGSTLKTNRVAVSYQPLTNKTSNRFARISKREIPMGQAGMAGSGSPGHLLECGEEFAGGPGQLFQDREVLVPGERQIPAGQAGALPHRPEILGLPDQLG